MVRVLGAMSFEQKFRSSNKPIFSVARVGFVLAFGCVLFWFIILVDKYTTAVKMRHAHKVPEQPIIEMHALRARDPPVLDVDDPEPKPQKPVHKVVTKPVPKAPTEIGFTNLTIYFERGCKGKSITINSKEHPTYSTCEKHDGKTMQSIMRSVRVDGPADVDIYEKCGDTKSSYWASVMEVDGCTNSYEWPPWGTLRFAPGTLDYEPTVATELAVEEGTAPAKYVVAYSVESSKYFGYQVYASLHGFQVSHQDDASYLRLLTCQKEDDLAQTVPTWTTKRHPYSRRYGPLNKPDITTKWFASSHAPKEEVIVMIDPDNWLTQNIRPFVDRVKRGHGVAQVAFYGGSDRIVRDMYQSFCSDPTNDGHCDGPLAMASVPYLLHRDDFKIIAPLWKMYALAIKERIEVDHSIAQKFGSLQVEWCAEMFAFNFACAHAGVTVTLEDNLQIRDVGTMSKERAKNIPMIHMGRAWFPRGHPGAKPFLHTEGRNFAHFGDQVWCKCNATAADVLPWPIPDNLDYVSDITLRYLHDSREKYGYVGESEFRPPGYHSALP